MREVAKQMYAEAVKAHTKVYERLAKLREQIGPAPTGLEDVTDCAHVLKLSSELMEDLRKELDKLKSQMVAAACILWSHRGVLEPIRTQHCVATPDIRVAPKIPKEGTPEYDLLLAHFGVPAGSPFRPHWPSLVARVTSDMRQGLPVPPGCSPDDTFKDYKLVTRKTKVPILVEDEAAPVMDGDLMQSQRAVLGQLAKLDFVVLDALKTAAEDYAEIVQAHEARVDEEVAQGEEAERTGKMLNEEINAEKPDVPF